MVRNSFLQKLSTSVAAIAFALLFAQAGHASDFGVFKYYFVNGDFATAGVGLRGTGQLDQATGRYLARATLTVPTCGPSGGLSCVPGDANGHPTKDLIAAFLYWISIEKTDKPSSELAYVVNPSYPASDPDPAPVKCGDKTNPPPRCKIVGKPLGASNAAPCWSNGGSTGSSQGAPTLRVYRADVLRFLDVDTTTKKKIPRLTFWVSDSGSNGSGVPLTEGATLVVVWRDPSASYKGIVFIDGAYTINNDTDFLEVKMNQFYQAATTQSAVKAKISYGVGDGQPNFPERLWFGNNNDPLVQLTSLGAAPFVGSAGPNGYTASGGFDWDNLTYDVSNLVTAGATSVTTRIDHGPGSFDCLSLGFIGASFTVQDTDEDGLLDVWETNGLTDPNNPSTVLVDLPGWGANRYHKDLFLEVDYMRNYAFGTSPACQPPACEKPSKAAIDMVGYAFKNAPVPNPDGKTGISLHVDFGPCPYPDLNACGTDEYILSTGSLEGGDPVNERSPAVYCSALGPDCVVARELGMVFWKQGLTHIKHAHVPTDPSDLSSGLSGKLYSNPNRDFVFHYVLFGRALITKDANGNAVATTRTGAADLLGRDLVVTLGKWTIRTPINEGGTLMHELGHNFGLYHGGTATGANCITTHVSSINYMYQTAGVFRADSTAVVDFSREALPPPAANNGELSLNEFAGLGGSGSTQYRLRWYAPRSNVATLLNVPLSSLKLPTHHCADGSAILQGEPEVVRADGFGVSRTKIDWNYNGKTIDTPAIDLDFNGITEIGSSSDSTSVFTKHYTGVNDWNLIIANHGLQQVGIGRSLYGLSLGVTFADLVHSGDTELGDTELGDTELGDTELGDTELGDTELGDTELGSLGLGDTELGASDEIDEPRANDIGTNLAPSGLTATSFKQGPVLRIDLSWTAPAQAPTQPQADSYTVYRSDGTEVAAPLTKVGPFSATTACNTAGSCTASDPTVQNNRTYTYFVIATFTDGSISGPSNPVTVIAR